jgi:putative flippase GtrA
MNRFDLAVLGPQFRRFLKVGFGVTALDYLVMIAAVQWLGLGSVLASGLGFTVGSLANYLFNRYYTFRSSTPHGTAMLRFMLVIGSGLGITLLLMYWFTARWALPYLLARMLTTGMVMFWHFAGNAFWSFAHPRKPS